MNASPRCGYLIGVVGVLLALALIVVYPLGPAAAGEDYSRVRVKEAGISLLVPKSWEPDLWTRRDAKRALADNPALRESGVTVEDILATPFAARWDGDADGFAERWMSIDREGTHESWLAPERRKRALEALGLDDVEVQRTRVGGKPALLSTASAPLNREDGSRVTAYGTQYSFANRGDAVITVGFYGLQADDPEYDEITDTMIGSVKFLR